MRGFKNQAWVTSALTDDDLEKCLILSAAFKSFCTNRWLAVITSPKLSTESQDALYDAFDFVFPLDDNWKTSHVKIAAVGVMRAFPKCVYISCGMMPLKNCDEIFDEEIDKENELRRFVFLENMDTSLFLFKPSLELFRTLRDGLGRNGNGVNSFLKSWSLNQSPHNNYLPEKYNFFVSLQNDCVAQLSSSKDISIVNFEKVGTDPAQISAKDLKSAPIPTQLAVHHWNDLVTQVKQGKTFSVKGTGNGNEPIAIVGMSCRYPNANNLEEFWNLLFAGEDGTSEPPPFRWLPEQSVVSNPEYRKTNAGFLKVPVDEFDSKFFGISPKEALSMDPQHRLLHEVIWEGLEDAAIDPHSLRDSSGSVFLGSWTNDYKDVLVQSGNTEFYRGYMGNSIGAMTARISHLLGLTGPSIATESGCSSAMVAVHLACKSLRQGETNLALAGGVNLLLRPFQRDFMPMVISPDGHCKTFDESANGFARAEGCGVLVLKRLSDAVRDGDRIWALIRGTGVSQEGTSKSMGTPTVHSESLAMEQALDDANVRPEEISYVEAHGTGTVVGDPLEVSAIAKVYRSKRRTEPLIIGSVKTNVGHTESCSGITGIMKVVLSMVHETIPAHRNFAKLNPAIDLEAVPATIPLSPVEWKKSENSQQKPRIAGVSSFGITGTDAHAVIQESPEVNPRITLDVTERNLHILKLSAKSEQALEIMLQRFKDHIGNSNDTDDPSLQDICFTANTGRANFSHRAIILGRSKSEMVDNLGKGRFVKGECQQSQDFQGKICFLFTGQGSQYSGMARNLYETSPVFQMHFDYCSKILSENYGVHIKDVLWSTSDSGNPEISRTIYSQTSIFCVEYALLKLWESLGITPDLVLGHSLGEFAAAVAAGILSVSDALKLVAERSLLIDKLPPGKMLVIKADQSTVSSHMSRFGTILDFAAINSAEQTVVAGDSSTILEFAEYLKTKQNLKCLVLEATHAFHSSHMDPMLDAYRKVAQTLKKCFKRRNQKCVYVSGLKGRVIDSMEEVMDPQYWVDHTREKVRFLEASKAVTVDCDLFIEIGPQPILSAMTMMNNEDKSLTCLPSLKKNASSDWEVILGSLGKLYLEGIKINWSGLDEFQRRKCRLPHYPFIGKKFWPDLNASGIGAQLHPLIGCSIPNPTSTKLFKSCVNLRSHEYIKDHAIGDHCIFPGAGYLEMCLAAGLASVDGNGFSPSRPMKLENLQIEAPLEILEGKSRQLHTVVEMSSGSYGDAWDGLLKVKIFQDVDAQGQWMTHATGTFSPMASSEDQAVKMKDVNENVFKFNFEGQCQEGQAQDNGESHLAEFYDKLATLGLKFGPLFRSIEKIWSFEDGHRLVAKIKSVPALQGQSSNQGQYILHPVVIDAMIQAIMIMKLRSNLKKKLFVPIKIGRFVWLRSPTPEGGSGGCHDTYIYVYDEGQGQNSNVDLSTDQCTAVLMTRSGEKLAIMSKVEMIDTTVKTLEATLEHQGNPLKSELWEEIWRPHLGTVQHRMNLEVINQTSTFKKVTMDEINCGSESPEYRLFQRLEQFCYLNVLRALYECGWSPNVNALFVEDELFKNLQISGGYKKLFHHYMHVLQMEGVVEMVTTASTGDAKSNWRWRVVTSPPSLEEVNRTLLSSGGFQDELIKNFNAALLFQEVGNRLSGILKGDQSALGVLFPESGKSYPTLADCYDGYANDFGIVKAMGAMAGKYIEHLKVSNGNQRFVVRILEVGAGTGGYTVEVLEQLKKHGLEFQYDFTDISSAFFPAAEKRFETLGQMSMTYRKLNIEEDPVTQGFIPEYYDYICASEVIHATKDIQRSLQNIRTLLKPGGRLDILEQTKVNRPITYLFGLLDGFWHFEDFDLRKDYCILSDDLWDQVFTAGGFKMADKHQYLNEHHSLFSVVRNTDDLRLTPSLKGLTSTSKIWLLFSFPETNQNQILQYLQDKLSRTSHRKVVTVTMGNVFSLSHSDSDQGQRSHFTVRPYCEQDFFDLMANLQDFGILEGVIYGWSLKSNVMATSQDDLLQPYFYMLKSLDKTPIAGQRPKVITLTSGVTTPFEDYPLGNIHCSTIVGITKSFRNERSEFQGKCLDIGAMCHFEDDDLLQIFYELWSVEKHLQVTFHEKVRYIPKMVQMKPRRSDLRLAGAYQDRFQLILPETKSIHDLEFGPLEPWTSLGDMEVEVQIKASALNFKDVLNVIKPTEEFKSSNSVGFDYAGIIKRVGSKVTQWSVGDRVFGVNYNGCALPSHTKQLQSDVIPVMETMTFCEAATLPAVFSTAYYCLVDLAKITSRDTVLIHAASGGVGQLAIQICRNVGATIICTAGSKRKQDFLRKNLGVQHIFHSRNTEYSEKILEVTKGHGVTVVLNSLTSEEFKEATLKCCAHGARFIEMSKLNIWTVEEVRSLRSDVYYEVVDLTQLEPSEARRLLLTLKDQLEQGLVKPIQYVRFDALKIREALQYLQKAKHIGKVVCVMPEMVMSPGVTGGSGREVMTPLFNKESTYLITGGLGGIGFTVCKWMVQRQGARWVILAGRRSPGPKMQREIEELNKAFGSKVIWAQLDVSDYSQCREFLESMTEIMGMPPLRGVMHCAGTLNDGLIDNQEWSKFSSTLRTKVQGTVNLHELTLNLDLKLEHFVLFSSVVAMFGSPGQGNHAAGNLFEDAFAHYRHSLGLPATTINWGQWGEVGIATEFEIPGIQPISNEQGLQGLDYCLRSPQRVQTSVVNIQSVTLITKFFPDFSTYIDEKIWRSNALANGLSSTTGVAMKSDEFWRKYDSLGNSDNDRREKKEFLQDQLRHILRNVLKLEVTEVIEDDANFQEMGVDSLMFVEMKNAIQTLLTERVTVNAGALRDCDNLRKLSDKLIALIEGDVGSSSDDNLITPPTTEEVASLIREDSHLPEHIRAKDGSRAVEVADIKVVMLTGVTGTLGPYILKELTTGCVSDQLTKVICLVRPQRHMSGERRLTKIRKERNLDGDVDMSKVTVVNGNVGVPKLGLDDSTWSKLIDEVDAIFHCAAMVQHIEYYRKSTAKNDMRSVNIGGTKNILEFATSGSILKRVFQCSTMFTATTVAESPDGSVSLSEKWPEVGDFDGVTTISYPVTKFVGDLLVKEAVLNRGIPAKVLRFPLIFGDSRTGRFVTEQNHAFFRYLFILKTGMMPSNPFPMMLLPVDKCASMGVKVFFDERFPFGEIYNLCHDRPQVDQAFVEVAKELGYDVDIVEFEKFAEKVRSSTEEDSPFALFKEWYRDESNVLSLYTTAPALRHWMIGEGDPEDGGNLRFFRSKRILECQPDFYETLEPANEYLYRDLKFARDNGCFQKYGLDKS